MQQVRLSSPIFRQLSFCSKAPDSTYVVHAPHMHGPRISFRAVAVLAWAYNTPHGPSMQATHTQNADQRPPIPSS